MTTAICEPGEVPAPDQMIRVPHTKGGPATDQAIPRRAGAAGGEGDGVLTGPLGGDRSVSAEVA